MRKLLLTKYNVDVVTKEGEKKSLPYDVVDSIIALLFSPGLKLGGVELLRQQQLAEKILKVSDAMLSEIVLEEEEYKRLKNAVEAFKGFGRNDVELVQRILEAVEIPTVAN